VVAYFQEEKNIEDIQLLIDHGLTFTSQAKESLGSSLQGKTFVISGIFANFERDEIKALIESHGGKVGSGVTGKTNYLVAGDGIGPSKLQKAQDLKVEIINELQLLTLIGDE